MVNSLDEALRIIQERGPQERKCLRRAGRQLRRHYSGTGRARRGSRHSDRSDLGARSAERLRAQWHDLEDALELRKRDPKAYTERSLDTMARHVEGMLRLQKMGAVTFDYGNNIRTFAFEHGVKNAYDFPGFVPEYIRPLFCEGRGPFRWARFRAIPPTFTPPTIWCSRCFPATNSQPLDRSGAQANQVPGTAVPHLLAGLWRAREFGLAINDLVKKGKLKAPIVMGRDHLDCGSVASPFRETES
jgi:urocanate hydratase